MGFGFFDIFTENGDGEIFVQAECLNNIIAIALAEAVANEGHGDVVAF